jgi:hypothetical protein
MQSAGVFAGWDEWISDVWRAMTAGRETVREPDEMMRCGESNPLSTEVRKTFTLRICQAAILSGRILDVIAKRNKQWYYSS